MPIAKEYKLRYYGHRWRTVIRPKILERSGGLCERCGRSPRILEVAHLDGVPGHDDEENLRALCSRCHHAHDFARWARAARTTRAARKDRARPLLREL